MQSGAGQLRRIYCAILAVLCGAVPALAEPVLREVANVTWQHPEPWFGGFSAIEVAEGGASATLLTDRGSLVTAALIRRDGTLSDLRLLTRKPLRRLSGAKLRGSERDAEGLAIARNGRAFVSYEFRDHVAALDLETGQNRQLGRHQDFLNFPGNRGLEALAIHPDGTLFTLSENRGHATGVMPVYQFTGGSWRISHRLSAAGGHVPVGADFDAKGRLFLLERLLTPIGFSSRIRLVQLEPGAERSRVLMTTVPGAYGNLEGISVWTDAKGMTRLTLVADDNFLPVQRTQIVEFTLTE